MSRISLPHFGNWSCFLLIPLGLLLAAGCGGGSGSGLTSPPPPASPRILFVSDREGRPHLYTMALDGTDVRGWAAGSHPPTASRQVTDTAPAWSPDRSRVAFVSDRSGVSHVFIAAADGSNPHDLTPGPAVCGAPAWSPDGEQLAYVQWEATGAQANIRVMRIDGSQSRALTADSGINGGPAWALSGRIYFTTNRERGGTLFDLYVMDETGGGQQKVADIPNLMGRPAVSPDGSRLVYVALVAPQTPGLFIMETGGATAARVGPTNSSEPAWSPDGRRLLFTSWQDGNAEVYSMDADGGNGKRLTASPAADGGATE